MRSKYTDEELAKIYAKPHDHRNWHDHIIRVEMTKQIAKWVSLDCTTVADLSCGNGEIIDSLNLMSFKGDFATGYQFHGPIERTINEIPNVDLFICSETIEHIDDPDLVLRKIRNKTKNLILSTPESAWNDNNPEHYWAWSADDIKGMLIEAGFTPYLYNLLELKDYLYDYQIWACR